MPPVPCLIAAMPLGPKLLTPMKALMEQLFAFTPSFVVTTPDFYNSSLSPLELIGEKFMKQTL